MNDANRTSPKSQTAPVPPPLSSPRVAAVQTLEYARPTGLGEAPGLSRWEGNLLVVPQGFVFPECCIKCGLPAAEGIRLKLTHAHPAWWLLALVSLPVFAIVYLAVAQSGTVTVWLCGAHIRERRRARRIWLSLTAAGLLLLAAGFVYGIIDTHENGVTGFLVASTGLLLVSIALLLSLIFEVVRARKINNRRIWLKGVTHTGF